MKLFLKLCAAIVFAGCSSNDVKVSGTADVPSDTVAGKGALAGTQWIWPDTLDATSAAPESHRIVHEDNAVRILQVICPPGKEEHVHTHRYRSTMWFTQSAHFIFYNYALDSNNQLVKTDSVEVPGLPSEIMNKGQMVPPEQPHSIRNIGTDTFMAYRVEYKR